MKPVMSAEKSMYDGSFVRSARDPETIVEAVAANEYWKIQRVYLLSSLSAKPVPAKC